MDRLEAGGDKIKAFFQSVPEKLAGVKESIKSTAQAVKEWAAPKLADLKSNVKTFFAEQKTLNPEGWALRDAATNRIRLGTGRGALVDFKFRDTAKAVLSSIRASLQKTGEGWAIKKEAPTRAKLPLPPPPPIPQSHKNKPLPALPPNPQAQAEIPGDDSPADREH